MPGEYAVEVALSRLMGSTVTVTVEADDQEDAMEKAMEEIQGQLDNRQIRPDDLDWEPVQGTSVDEAWVLDERGCPAQCRA